MIGGGVLTEVLSPSQSEDLWQSQGWGEEVGWALLTPDHGVLPGAPGACTGPALLAAMHAAGGTARFELRQTFLEEHPDQGEARQEALNEALTVARWRYQALKAEGRLAHTEADPGLGRERYGFPPGPEGDALAEDLLAEPAAATEALLALPGWSRGLLPLRFEIPRWDLARSARMRGVLAQLATLAEQRLVEDPYADAMARTWAECASALGRKLPALAEACTPVPGRVWPTELVLNEWLSPLHDRLDWTGLLAAVNGLAPQALSDHPGKEEWAEYCQVRGALAANATLAHAGLGSWEQAATALGEACRWAGRGATQTNLLVDGGWRSVTRNRQAWQALLNRIPSSEGPRPPAPPPVDPLRLVLLGLPPWREPWAALSAAPELALWSPAELSWLIAPVELQERLRRARGWGPEPRWALLRGEDVRGTGTACPTPAALAGLLEAEGSSDLQRLGRLLDRQPGHLAARKARLALLAARMPNPVLEPMLVEDAVRTGIGPVVPPSAVWRPDGALWAEAARTVLPRLQEELRSWPSAGDLWRAWLAWAPWHPEHPSTLALAQSLAYWEPGRDGRAGLPDEVHRAVAGEFRRRGDFIGMRDWFQAAWQALDQRPLKAIRPREQRWALDRRQEEETVVYLPLREALQALHCTEQLQALDRTFAAMVGRP